MPLFMMDSRQDSPSRGIFVGLSLATTIATYVLIGVGALVRAAGAGLGCPDWPRCFGNWVPPTSAADLPPGFDTSQFSMASTWLEYVNRLVGVTIGLLIFATLVSAWRWYRGAPRVVWPIMAAFVLVGFQGWLGGQVVAKELADDVLTLHLVVALVIVGLLLYGHLCARFGAKTAPAGPAQRRVGLMAWAVMLLSLLQAGLGTRVRGAIQALEKADVPRAEWLPLGWWPDLAHRQFAVMVLAACAVLVWATRRNLAGHGQARVWAMASLVLAALQIVAGLGLAYIAVPPVLQIVHLVLASLLVGALSVYIFFVYRPADDVAPGRASVPASSMASQGA